MSFTESLLEQLWAKVNQRYHYNIFIVRDAADALGNMKDLGLDGWETVGIFTDKSGNLMLAAKKPMTPQEEDLARRQKAAADERARKQEHQGTGAIGPARCTRCGELNDNGFDLCDMCEYGS
jgi:hypothetical protein